MHFLWKKVLSFKDIDRYCQEFVAQIDGEHFDYLISIQRGGWYPGKKIAEILQLPQLPLTIFRKIYFPQSKWLLALWYIPVAILYRIIKPSLQDYSELASLAQIKGKKVLVVDDAIDSGETMKEVKQLLLALGAESVSAFVISEAPGLSVANWAAMTKRCYFPWSRLSSQYNQWLALFNNR